LASGQQGFCKILQDTSGADGKLRLKIRILQKLAILTQSTLADRLSCQPMSMIDAKFGLWATRFLQNPARYIGCPWQATTENDFDFTGFPRIKRVVTQMIRRIYV